MRTLVTMLYVSLATVMFLSCSRNNDSGPPKLTITDTPWLGIEINENEKSLLVQDVVSGSPAELAGVKEGDVLTTFNGKVIENVETLQQYVNELGPFKKASIAVVRGQTTDTLSVRPSKLFLMDDVLVSATSGFCTPSCNCTYDSMGVCIVMYRHKGPMPGGKGQRFAKACNDKECYDVVLL